MQRLWCDILGKTLLKVVYCFKVYCGISAVICKNLCNITLSDRVVVGGDLGISQIEIEVSEAIEIKSVMCRPRV